MPLNTTNCVLLICICSIVFHRCEGQETSASPVRGFIGLNTLRRKAVLLYNSDEQYQQQRIFPSMNFSCSGTISKWTFVARSQTGGDRDQYPLFQLWRPSGTRRYERVYELSSDSGNFTMLDVSGITTGEYLPHDPVPFRANYILGVYQPGSGSNSRLSLIHVSVPGVFGRENYVRQNETSLSVFNISGAVVGNDDPLVAVNTTSPWCVQGFLNEEAVRITADVYATSNTYNVRRHERQQRIIPGINFTCTGTLTKWIIGAQITQTQATNHLQLQIWRRRGSSNTYNRTTFSDITALNATDDLNVYEYIPNPPLEFQANDILGLFQSRIRDTQVALYYQIGGGPQTFRIPSRDSPLVNINAPSPSYANLPLVAVEVNRSAENCTQGFITRERLADEALLIGDFAYMYGRQLIIPNMTFTSSGSVVRWTFAARYRASATQYPELQVWRENTTGRYVRVASTVNMEPAQTAYLNVYEYVLDPPLQVLAGDVLGIYQPSSTNSRVQLLFLSDSNHVNWFTTGPRPQDSFMVAGSQTNNAIPLVTVSFDPDGETLSCDTDTTEFLSWPETPAGTTQSLCCPSTTTIINRTCSSSGMWESVDPSLCTPFTSINVANITLDNYEEVLTNVSGAVRGAAINEQEQTTDNLAMVAAAFARSAALVNKRTIIPNTTVNDLINTLEGLQQWNEGVLQANSSNIVHSFEVIVGVFAQQLEDGERFSFTTETILFVAESQSQTELTANGRSFSSSGQTGNTNISALSEDETAAAFLPPSLFQSITDRNSTGIFFAVYDTGVFFPITNATELVERTNTTVTTVVDSPVLAATVGPGLNFSGLEEPVRIILRLNEQGPNVRREAPRCVSWEFDSQEWTTEGCETNLAKEDRGVVTCRCNHLTNFAILVDICARFQESCRLSGAVQTALEVLSIVGAVLSLVGIAATIFTLLVFKKLRERHPTIFHTQLCIALFCMLITFVCGIDRTSVYGGCVLVSVLIHYFTLVAVMFMGAEAVLMFKKLIIVFSQTTTKFFVTISLICWLVPIIPVVIPMAVDLSDTVSRDLVVRRPTEENNGRGFCFIDDIGVFFGAFLGPIFAILIFNAVIFVMVINVLIKHTQKTLDRTKEQMKKKTAIRLLISIASVMSLFGLTWLFGALTVTGFGSAAASIAFQVLFVIFNAFQGFFVFLFFCMFNKDARDLWIELLLCGHYKSKPLHSSQAKYSNSGTRKKVKTSNTGLTDSNLTSATSSKTGYNSSTDDLVEDERYTDIPLTSVAGQDKEKPSVVTFKDDSEIYETNVGADKKIDLGSSEVKKKEQSLEKSDNSEERASPYQWREDGVELKARVKRFSTKKAYKHHVESAEVDFLDSDSDGSDNTNA